MYRPLISIFPIAVTVTDGRSKLREQLATLSSDPLLTSK